MLINGKLKNKIVDEISHNRDGNMGLTKKDIKPYVENKSNAKSTVKIPFE